MILIVMYDLSFRFVGSARAERVSIFSIAWSSYLLSATTFLILESFSKYFLIPEHIGFLIISCRLDLPTVDVLPCVPSWLACGAERPLSYDSISLLLLGLLYTLPNSSISSAATSYLRLADLLSLSSRFYIVPKTPFASKDFLSSGTSSAESRFSGGSIFFSCVLAVLIWFLVPAAVFSSISRFPTPISKLIFSNIESFYLWIYNLIKFNQTDWIEYQV